jgi:WD40 repeat protein
MHLPTCPTHEDLALSPKRLGWYCSACDDVVLGYNDHPRDGDAPNPGDSALLSSLPTLVALPLAEAQRESRAVLALWALCDTVELALKLVAMAGIGEHLAISRQLPDKLASALHHQVELPTMGKWLGIAAAVATHRASGSTLPLQEAVRDLDALLGKKGASVDDGLLALRNRLAHGGPVANAEASRLLAIWRPRVFSWARGLVWLSEARLIAVDAVGTRVLLRGESIEDCTSSTPVPADAPPGSAWLCVGAAALPLGPLGSFDNEDRTPQIYVRAGEVRLQYLRLGSAGGLTDSNVDAREHFHRLFLAARPPAASAEPRQTIKGFRKEVKREAARCIGRVRELAILREAAHALTAGAIWISGAAGIGKSNLLASLMEELQDAPPAGVFVLPYRFRAGDDRCGRAPFLTYLTEQLTLGEALVPHEESASDGHDPIREVIELLARLKPELRVLLVVDGLDEIVERDPRFVEDVLFAIMEARVALIAAGRPERGLPEAFAKVGAQIPFPNGLPPMSIDDIRAMLLERTGGIRKRLLAIERESGGAIHNSFIDGVVKRSEGLPLYINYVVGDLNAGKLSPEQSGVLPASLHAYHEQLLTRVSVGDVPALLAPLLVLLALAHEPLTLQEQAALLARAGRISDTKSPAVTTVEKALQAIGAMIRSSPDPDGGDGYTIYHHSLRTHVLTTPTLTQTVATMRTALATAALTPAGDAAEAYLYRCGARHLLETGRSQDVMAQLTNFTHLMARFQCLAGTGRAAEGWYADWDLLHRAGEALVGDAPTWWDFARAARYLFQKDGWEAWRVLFQAAMDHADDSPVTMAAEAFEASGQRDWAWLRWKNRPNVWRRNACVAVMAGHSGPVEGAFTLPDGRVVSWSSDGSVRAWDPASGQPLAVLKGYPNRESNVGATRMANGHIITWAGPNPLRTWDTTSDAPLVELPGRGGGGAGTEGALALENGRAVTYGGWRSNPQVWNTLSGDCVVEFDTSFYPSVRGQILLAGERVLNWAGKSLHVWDPQTGQELATLRGHTQTVDGAVQLRDGRVLSWAWDCTLRLWNTRTGADLGTFAPSTSSNQDWARTVVELSDSRLVSGWGDGKLRVWDPASSASAEFDAHLDPVGGLLALGDDLVLSWAAGCAGTDLQKRDPDFVLYLWDMRSGKKCALSGHVGEIQGALALSDGRILSFSSDSTLRIWDRLTGEPLGVLRGHTAAVTGALSLPNGRAVSWSVDGTLRIWDLADGQSVAAPVGHASRVTGTLALSGGYHLSWGLDRTLCAWDITTGSMVTALKGHTRAVLGACELTDGRIVSWSRDRTLRIWDLKGGAPPLVLKGHTEADGGACVLRDGRILSWATSGRDTMRLWNAASGEPAGEVKAEGHGDYRVENAVELADGRVASWSGSQLRVWDLTTGRWLLLMHKCNLGGVLTLADGRILSWGDGAALFLWNGQTGASLPGLEGHEDDIGGAIQLEDGRVLSWSDDLTLRVWDVTTGAQLAKMVGHSTSIRGATPVPSGKIVSWSQDQVLHLWDAASGALLGTVANLHDWSPNIGRSPSTQPVSAELAALTEVYAASQLSLYRERLDYSAPGLAVFIRGVEARLCEVIRAPA